MAKYRKKPVVIEAFQITVETRNSNCDWPDWMHRAWQKDVKETGALYPMYERPDDLAVFTLEGIQRVTMNDYIIQGVMGEIYPCKPDIFELTYEVVE